MRKDQGARVNIWHQFWLSLPFSSTAHAVSTSTSPTAPSASSPSPPLAADFVLGGHWQTTVGVETQLSASMRFRIAPFIRRHDTGIVVVVELTGAHGAATGVVTSTRYSRPERHRHRDGY